MERGEKVETTNSKEGFAKSKTQGEKFTQKWRRAGLPCFNFPKITGKSKAKKGMPKLSPYLCLAGPKLDPEMAISLLMAYFSDSRKNFPAGEPYGQILEMLPEIFFSI